MKKMYKKNSEGKIKKIIEEELVNIKPPYEQEERIRGKIKDFIKKLDINLRKFGAKVIVGGSFAKGTTIKKRKYDVDLFGVFNDDKDISDKLEKSIKKTFPKIKYSRLPGSRDYFSIDTALDKIKFKIEIIPVFKIKKSKEARNVTDVSLLHVRYIKSKINKNNHLSDEIKLTKAFCYSQDCYGAESYIQGFSGYCLEILTAYYGGFLKLLKEASKWPDDKKVIDPQRYYRNSNEIMNELNEAKLSSPLILIDPVQKNRNAAAALSYEKYIIFRESSKKFLKNPSKKFFRKGEFNSQTIINNAKKKNLRLFEVDSESLKVKEDISGAKLLKLHNLLKRMLEKERYIVKDKWDFMGQRSRSFFSLKQSKEIIQKGPPVSKIKHAKEFRKRWKKAFIKQGNLYVKRRPKEPRKILNLNKTLLEDMGIDSFRVKKIL